ncbi:MAG: MopE-related protein [Pseudomonadota bacterium]|nr:MopE-related protein [Pseudomonadota bacterium]
MRLSLLLLCTLGCDPTKDKVDVPDVGIDEDGDGVSAADDCDDDVATSFPGAPELCDGVDNDCDGESDEDATDASTWYADVDGDGYGDASTATTACEAPEGHVAGADDCDDGDIAYNPGAAEADCADPNDYNCDGSVGYADADGDGYAACAECDDADIDVNPVAIEVCDAIDNNCDGVVDEGVTATYWQDADGDGWGDDAVVTAACELPAGYAALGGDCDDALVDVNPDATELCDTLDNDCDGTVDEPDAADAATWYADTDADGFGDPSSSSVSCDATGVADATDCDDAVAATNPDATEVCDTVDNDCDGTVDEPDAADASTWYADIDGDGFGDAGSATLSCDAAGIVDSTDCDDDAVDVYPGAAESWYDGVDSDCDGAEDPDPCDGLPGAATVAYDTGATVTTSPLDWSVAIEWQTDDFGYSAGSAYTEVMMTPVVGQVTDDDGDGDIDERDMPDVLFTAFTGSSYGGAGYLRAFSGDGTGEHWSLTSVGGYSVNGAAGVAVGDIEGDGSPDILTMSTGGHVMALEHDGTLKWVSTDTASMYSSPALHDMDADGCVEIIASGLVLDCTGATLAALGSTGGTVSFAADVDLDGTPEVVTGDATWDIAGAVEIRSSMSSGSMGAVGNFDSDDAAELVAYQGGVLSVVDGDGSLLWTSTVASTGNTPPCVADFDGDGSPEIGVASASEFSLVDTDGATLWTATTYDPSSGTMTCSAFDFDGDGASEVVYIDRTNLFIWDGATGTELYTNESMASGSIYENAVIADVDNDGAAELVVPANNYSVAGWQGVVVLGEENDLWASARNVWNQHAYSSDNVNDDLSIPTSLASSWLDHQNFRGQVSWSDDPAGAPDLETAVIGVCEACSSSGLEVYVVLDNTGAVFVPAGVNVALYADSGGTRTLLDVQQTSDVAYPGDRLAPLTFSVAVGDLGTDGLVVVVDDDGVGAGAHTEADETNNEGTWDALTCP